jgi:hypothetical protein
METGMQEAMTRLDELSASLACSGHETPSERSVRLAKQAHL